MQMCQLHWSFQMVMLNVYHKYKNVKNYQHNHKILLICFSCLHFISSVVTRWFPPSINSLLIVLSSIIFFYINLFTPLVIRLWHESPPAAGRLASLADLPSRSWRETNICIKLMRWIVRFDFLGCTVGQYNRFMCESCGWEGSSTLGESKPIGVMNCCLNLIDHLLCRLSAEWHHY